MKPGDVFKIRGEDQSYLVDAVAPSGLVFARRFDEDKGAFGELVVFSPSTEILFSTLQPEEEEGYEHCEIAYRVRLDDGCPVEEWFEAEAEGPTGKYTAKLSKSLVVIKGEPILEVRNKKSEAIHQQLVDDLLGDGWELVPERRLPWYQQRLKRKIDY